MVTVISTFAGCGGSSLGYKWAGYKELLAIDWEQNAVDTFALNFPEVPVWKKDITTVSVDEILKYCNIKVGELDVLDGSPPCQGFSWSGKRQVADTRNQLFKEYVRLIDGLQPKVFVMENVSAMVQGSMKGIFIEIMNTLKALNYNVKCKVMNAMWYEVAQSRERVIFIGVRKDLNKQPVFPKASNSVITAKQALKGVENKTYPPWNYTVNKRAGKPIIELFQKLKYGEHGDKYLGSGRGFSIRRIHPNKPSKTLMKTTTVTSGLIHYSENRHLTIEECKRITSFPDSFQLLGSFRTQTARLGNAVMPKFMYHIAKTIKEQVLD